MANPTVDKFKIDNSVYDVQDTQARTDIAKKIDKDTVGDLVQTVSGAMSAQSVGRLTLDSKDVISLNRNGVSYLNISDNSITLGSMQTSVPVSFYGVPQFRRLSPVNIDDNFAYVTMRTSFNNTDTKFVRHAWFFRDIYGFSHYIPHFCVYYTIIILLKHQEFPYKLVYILL